MPAIKEINVSMSMEGEVRELNFQGNKATDMKFLPCKNPLF